MKNLDKALRAWLEKNGESVEAAELERYNKQLDVAEEMCKIYDKYESDAMSPEDDKRVLELLTQFQALGSPPEEVVKEIGDAEIDKLI